jgi:ATP-dependent exoDNAse (exonuclease V) alpha subunit
MENEVPNVAIYHMSVKIVSRGEGRSVVAAAAYRAGQRLEDEATGSVFDYTRKGGVAHTEIIAPQDAPTWVYDRERLWNVVEKSERRRDAQLAREIEVALPIELGLDAQVAVMRDFAHREFVSNGMIADLAIHRNDENNPHAHLLLTLRKVAGEHFGRKERSWNERSRLKAWRLGWQTIANEYLARAGLEIRIDHRTLDAQGIELVPGRKIGVGRERQRGEFLPDRIAERVFEQRRIAKENGERILANPKLALAALSQTYASFTEHEVARFLSTRTEGPEQFRAAYHEVMASEDLVALERGGVAERYALRHEPVLDPDIGDSLDDPDDELEL